MKPLLQYPVSRATIADALEFVARAGAKLVILDADFPQYSSEDEALARAIHRCANGAVSATPVPVLMTASVTRRSYDSIVQLHGYSPPRGVLERLSVLEPQVDVVDKYTGSAGLLLDEDQVVRQLACRVPGRAKDDFQESVAVKALRCMQENVPADLPEAMDIDFAGPPGSELYKIRPFWYLLDPDKRALLANCAADSSEPVLKDAVVIIGDGITDLHNTPFTNLGANLRSGSEVLAQALDTVSRRSWPTRPDLAQRMIYWLALVVASGAVYARWKSGVSKLPAQEDEWLLYARRMLPDLSIVGLSLALSWLGACYIFAVNGFFVPVIVPCVSILAGSLSAAVWQGHHEQITLLRRELTDAKSRLILLHEKHQAEMREQAAMAGIEAIQQDRERRREFGRRLNHDLKAPLSILNWTLAKLRSDGLMSPGAEDKLERLFKTANRLFNLIGELSRSYDYEVTPEGQLSDSCNVREVVFDCVTLHKAVADMIGSRLELELPADNDVRADVGSFQLTRVVDNLIGNAIVHNPQGTAIKVTLSPGTEAHEIQVSDNGVGIPSEKLSEESLKRGSERGNSGLGLSIVHALVRDMKGELTIKSTSERGTTIIVRVPAASSAVGASASADSSLLAIVNDQTNESCASKGGR